MDGQKDEATLKYEKEIRLGMVLLGVLAFAFVGVLARRVWMENSQVSASTKKPIYLSKVERDALRTKAKPLPLFSTKAPTRLHVAAPSRSELRAAAQAKLEKEAEQVPDLDIEEIASTKAPSQPASFTQSDESPKTESTDVPEPSKNPQRKEKASPISEATNPANDDESTLAQETQSDSPAESKPSVSRFSTSRPAPRPNDEKLEPTTDLSSPMVEQTSEADKTPKAEEAPNVRKKSAANPWKRTPSETPIKPAGAQHTVIKGDTLKSIARDLFDDESRWREIYDLNRDVIGDDFGYLKLGLKLRLPSVDESPPSEADPAASSSQVRDPK